VEGPGSGKFLGDLDTGGRFHAGDQSIYFVKDDNRIVEIYFETNELYAINISLESVSYSIPDSAITDRAALAQAPGGIDLNTSNGMQWKVSKDGKGVEMDIDPALIERIKREGIDSLTPVIFRVTPVVSIWPLLGLEPSKRKEERLAGVGA